MPVCRTGRPGDVDAIAEIIALTAAQDPSCDYRWPLRDEFLDDFSADCLQKARQYLDNYVVVVYEVPVAATDGSEASLVIAFSCWNPVLPPGSDTAQFASATSKGGFWACRCRKRLDSMLTRSQRIRLRRPSP